MSTQQECTAAEPGIPIALAALTFALIILLAGVSGYILAQIR